MIVRRKVCVIGSGISGLAAAKAFRDRGHAVTVFERGPNLGGVWEPSRSYPDVKTQTPRDLYAFSELPMPRSYPEWPSGGEVFDYLKDYARRFELTGLLQFGQTVTGLTRRPAGGWDVAVTGPAGARVEPFDFVAVCSGQFSQKNKPEHPGAEAFEARGGRILHSSEHTDAEAVRGRRVLVLGYSKSATDVAVSAVRHGAAAVTLVYLEPAWKIPYFFGGLVNFKNILYCRAAEAMFLPFDAGPVRRAAQVLAKPLIWANWRALETLLNLQFGLKRNGLRPTKRIEDEIHCNLAVETPGFYRLVSEGRIAAVQGTIARYEDGAAVLTGGQRIDADLVVTATGWKQEVPFLSAADRAKLVDADGQYRLYRWIVNPDVPDLGFVGFNSSFATNLSAELGANWLVRYMDGQLRRQPSRAAMEAEIARSLEWRRGERPSARGYGGLCIAPYHNRHFGVLLADMGAPTRGSNPLVEAFAPLRPPAYAGLLARAPTYTAQEAALRVVGGVEAA